MRTRILISLVLGALALGAAPAGSASAAMYWGNGSTVAVAEPDGSSLSPAFPTGGSSTLMGHGPVCDVAVSPTHLYWNEWGVVNRIDLNGGTAQPVFVGAACKGIALSGSHVYWAGRDGSIGRANLDGSEPNPHFISGSGVGEPCGLVVGGGYLYWTGSRFGSSVGRARLDGSEVEPELFDDTRNGCSITADAEYLYWAGSYAIGRANLDGSEPNPSFIPGYRVSGLAVWGPYLYWVEGGHPGSIGRANLDGSAPNRLFLPGQATYASGIVFDARPAPPRRLSSPVEVAKVKHLKGKGAVYVWVTVPGHGELTVKAKGARWRVLRDDRPLSHLGPFEVKLKLWPGAGGKEAKRVRKQLRREGRARVFLKLGYVEEDSLPISGGKFVELVRKRRG